MISPPTQIWLAIMVIVEIPEILMSNSNSGQGIVTNGTRPVSTSGFASHASQGVMIVDMMHWVISSAPAAMRPVDCATSPRASLPMVQIARAVV